MRILVISNLYPPDFLGGYELGCRQAVEALRAAGHEVAVLTAAPRVPVPADPLVCRRLKLTDIYDPYYQTHARPLSHRLRFLEAHAVHAFNVHALGEVVESFRPDVAYVWNVIGLGGLGVIAGLQHLGVPWVMHLMDAVPMVMCGLGGGPIPEIASAFLKLCRGRFISCSQTTVNEITASGVPIGDRTTVIPNWVDTPGTPGRREYMPRGRLRVVSAGSMSTAKGMDIIIRAAALLRDRRRTNFSVDLYGPAADPLFQTLIQSYGLQDSVRIRGVRTQPELDALYREYDVFAFPTWEREPFGFAPMEAAAHGCVAVVSRVCGFAEWFVDGVDCLKIHRDPASLALVLEHVMTGAVPLADIGRRGAQVINRDFRLTALLPRIEAELRRAARAGGGPARPATEAYRLALLAEKSLHCLIQETAAA